MKFRVKECSLAGLRCYKIQYQCAWLPFWRDYPIVKFVKKRDAQDRLRRLNGDHDNGR